MLLTYFFNFVLHLFYGNSVAFIYTCHYNFLIFFILAYIIKFFNFKISKKVVYFIIPIVILSLKTIVNMFAILSIHYSFITYFRMLNFIVAFVIASIISIIIFKNKYLKVIFCCYFFYFHIWSLELYK